MQIDHALLSEIEMKHTLGRAAAERYLRGVVAGVIQDAELLPKATKALAEIDAARAEKKAALVATNADMAKRLGLDTAGADSLTAKLVADTELLTWLTGRVHLSLASGRPLTQDE